jgi:lipoprotein-anchoring transpeptidase ErfK/SrfK
VRRIGFAVLVLCVGVAGAAAAYALAETPPPPPTPTTQSDPSTPTEPTESIPTETTPTTPTKPPRKRSTIPAGVTIAGIHVGGLAYGPAYSAVSVAFRSPLALELADRTVTVSPFRFQAKPYISAAVRRALASRPGARVHMLVAVRRSTVTGFVNQIAARFDREVADAHVVLHNLRPQVTAEHTGRTVMRGQSVAAIVRALQANRREAVELPARIEQPKVKADSFHSIIVIQRGSKALTLYRQTALDRPATFLRRFGVATGQAIYPTPIGSFQIVIMERNPWWFPPPDAEWAKGEKPIPPGPGNPLGTRWMGLSAPGVGIHGTPDPASIGYSASHGCVRMYIPDAEWLFNHVEVGTPVLIVPA